jgi:hypothetical protein
MKTKRNRGLRKSALVIALGLGLAGQLQAQTNSSGSIAGSTTAGGSVVIENPATGFRREVTAGADGSYRVGALPTGTYKVTANGQTREVTVTIGGTAQAGSLDTVTVVGSASINSIDVASVESTTILTAEQIAKIPVSRDITSVALLAPGTVRGDAAFGNLASFGGGAVSENQYFVNGFNISNAFKNLNFGQVPFEAIAEQQVKTGGYGAEFGRATGGVINLVTKRGSNEFHAGGNVFWTPDSLRGTNPDVYYKDPRYPDGKRWVSDNSKDTLGTTVSGSVWASGALVQDRLFAYALLQYARTTGRDSYARIFDSQNSTLSQTVPTWLLKLDWNISDNHLLELTAFSDTIEQETAVYANPIASRSLSNLNEPVPYPPLTPETTDLPASVSTQRGAFLGTIFDESGGESASLKYTGYLSDNFTLSALYGHGESSRANYGRNAAGLELEYTGDVGGPVSGCPVIQSTVEAPPAGCWFLVNANLGVKGAKDERDQFRVDAEWTLGDHLLRFGYDADFFTSVDGETTEGGSVWQYRTPVAAASASTPGLVRRRIFQSGATVEINSEAFYIEDRWQMTPNFLAYLGLRWDSFENVNGDGDVFVEIKNQFGPRLGFAWDVNGDASLKVYGNAGRYALPLTATVAVRGASASLFAEQFYSFTGVDPVTGAPTGIVNLGNPNCGGCDTRYLNNEFGVAKDARTIADQELQPMYQDEYILGLQAQLTDHVSAGARAIYRDLRAAIDDQCDYGPILEWAEANGYDVSDPFTPPPPVPDGAVHVYNPGFAFCHLYNPGRNAVFQMDVDGDGDLEQVEIAAEDLGPKAVRTYKALEFFVEGSWDKFFLQGSYTWSKSHGNTEGGVKSDIGQDDTGTTQDFDYPELMIGALGYLPNDRRHAFKLFGNYQLTDEWSFGANLLVQSGRPLNCFGFLGGSNTSGYSNSYFSCDPGRANLPGDGAGNNGDTIVPRGSVGRTEWMRTLDLNVAYRPNWAEGRLTLKADVFNVFDEHAVTSVIEQGENTAGQPQPDRYLTPTTFQAPRSVRFMVQYEF